METPTSWPWRVLRVVGTWLLALLILFEEWGWMPLARWMGVLARLPGIAWLERKLAALPPAVAVVVLFIPTLLLLPVKLGALWFIAGGRAVMGLMTLIVAKLLGTAVVARLFMLMKPQMLRLPWFARAYARWSAWKAVVVARVVESRLWRVGRAVRWRWRRMWGGH